MSRIYLDNAATTPMREVALQAMIEQARLLGNPSSLHGYGREVRKRVEEAREEIARIIDCHPSEVVFTGSGTEANNLALKGIYWQRRASDPKLRAIVISGFEHHAVLDPAEWLRDSEGAELIFAPVDAAGYLDLVALQKIIESRGDEIALISIMHSNNEVGTIQPIADVVRLANARSIPVHSDAIQSLGKVHLSFEALGLFAMTISAHKIGGPVGVGALILRRGVDITPLLHGGGQERDVRSGTLSAASIVAFAAAAKAADQSLDSDANYVSSLRDRLSSIIKELVPDAMINGGHASTNRLPGILNVRIPSTESDSLLLLFDNEGIACSTGSACSAGVQQPSHVLLAMGLSEREARSSLRFSLGPTNTDGDLERFKSCLQRVIERARAAYRSSV